MKAAVIALTNNGCSLALKVKAALGCDAYLKQEVKDDTGAIHFQQPLKELVAEIYSQYDAFILIMATGIAFRTFAPYAQSKYKDPALVVMDEKGQFAISLLSGHLGGANDLAAKLEEKLGAKAVITTATDVNQKIAFDMVAKKNHLIIENPHSLAGISSAVVNGAKVALFCNYNINTPLPPYIVEYKEGAKEKTVLITNRVLNIQTEDTLILRPQNLVLGMGCRRDTDQEKLTKALEEFMKAQGFSSLSLRAVASIDLKRDEQGLVGLCKDMNLPFITFSGEELADYKPQNSGSSFVRKITGTASVSEAAAWKCGKNGKILVPKTIVNGITFSLAEDETFIEL